jgi:hypothetical protein
MKAWGVLLAALPLLGGCQAALRLQVGTPTQNHCPDYTPPTQELPPQGVGVDALPYEFSEAVALALGTEVKALREYIARRDRRDQKAMEDYRLACQRAGKTVQDGPTL